MADFTNLKADFNQGGAHEIYTNGQQAISGERLNYVLNNIVDTMNEEKSDLVTISQNTQTGGYDLALNAVVIKAINAGYQYMGIATPDTNPGTLDQKVFYIANGKGTYANFGGLSVTEDEVVFLHYDTEWHKMPTGIASNEEIQNIDTIINGKEWEKIFEMDSGQHLTWDFVPNPFMRNDQYKYDANIEQSNWTNVGFSKVNTGTPTTADMNYIVQTRTIGELTGTGYAPDPTVYPYIAYQKNGAENPNTVKVYRYLGIEGLAIQVPRLEAKISDIDVTVNGRNDELILEMDSAAHTSYVYLPNPLAQGDKYRAEMDVTMAQWTRLYFTKNGTGSPAAGDYLEILVYNVIGHYEIEGYAPDPTVYPYIAYQKNGASNTSTAKLFRALYQQGLTDKVNNIINGLKEINTVSTNLIVNDLWVYSGAFSQNSAWITKYIYAKRGYTYTIDASITTRGLQISICNDIPGSNVVTNLVAGSANDTTIKHVVEINKPCFIAISYAKSGVLTLSINEEIAVDKLTNIRALPLYGKRVLMFGDSITQLPLDSADGAKGIAEYFSDVTGSNGIRSGFGGSHLRARRIVNAVTDIDLTDDSVEMQEYAKATLDLVYIVRSLCEQDFTLQDRAMEWYRLNRSTSGGVDDAWTYWANTINMLKSLDVSTISAFTIFIGTNDYSNNVLFNDENKTAAESTNIQRENGAWNYVLEMLSTTYPTIPIFIFTPIVRMDATTHEWIPDTPNGAGLTLRQYAENTISAAKRFYIPVCDLMNELGWNQFNFWSFFNTNDGTHPRKGFQHIGTKMASFITSHWNRY